MTHQLDPNKSPDSTHAQDVSKDALGFDVEKMAVERLMRNAVHIMPPGVKLTPAEHGALVDYARAVLEEAAKLAENFIWFDEENCAPDEANIFIAKKLRALAEGVR